MQSIVGSGAVGSGQCAVGK